jgi:putative toxin-antitoxin system antitoxin component (TIGR02293 family)
MAKKEARGVEPDIAKVRARLRRRRPGQHFYVGLLGLDTYDTLKLLERVEKGLSFQALERFRKNTHLSMTELADLVQIKARTLARRREAGRLEPDESDRLLRASRIFGLVLRLFEGDLDAARTWLSTPQMALGGVTPLEVARTGLGAREVENLVGRLEHGVFS